MRREQALRQCAALLKDEVFNTIPDRVIVKRGASSVTG